MSIPQLSSEQLVAAREAATHARRARAELKEAVRTGKVSFVEALEKASGDEVLSRIKVVDLLRAVPRVGATRARDHGSAADRTESSHPRTGQAPDRAAQRAVLTRPISVRVLRVNDARTASVWVISGPSGVGKGTVCAVLRQRHPEAFYSVSATTRAARAGEVDGVSYHFLGRDQFRRMVEYGDLLEWAVVHGDHYYGTPKQPVEDALQAGRVVVLEIDLQGARQVKQNLPEAQLVFLSPPSWEELVARLAGRGTEDEAARQRRLETAKKELASIDQADHVIVNREIEETVEALVSLLGL